MVPSSSIGSASSFLSAGGIVRHSQLSDRYRSYKPADAVLLTCMDRQLRLAGVGAGQVLGSAGVHAGVFTAGVEDDQGIFWVIVDEGEVAALLEENVVLQSAIALKWAVTYRLICSTAEVKGLTLYHRMSGSGFPSTTTAKRDVSPTYTSTSSMIVSNFGRTVTGNKIKSPCVKCHHLVLCLELTHLPGPAAGRRGRCQTGCSP